MRKVLAFTFVFSAMFASALALTRDGSSVAIAGEASVAKSSSVMVGAKELMLAPEAKALACNQMKCHSNDDCGYPDVCGACRRTSGQWFGTCAPTP